MRKKFVYRDTLNPWGWLFVGALFTIKSLFVLFLLDDGYIWRGGYIPKWFSWISLPIGIGLTVSSLCTLIRRKGKSTICTETDTNTDEEFAEAEMDALYLREYGELPEKPKLEMTESKTIEGEIAEPVKPQKGTELNGQEQELR